MATELMIYHMNVCPTNILAACIQWNPSIVDTLGFCIERCPHFRGKLSIFGSLVPRLGRESGNEATYLGRSKMPLIQRCPFSGCPLREAPQ